MVAAIWGQTRNLGDRTLDPVDLPQRRSGGHSRLWWPDVGTDTKFKQADFWAGGPDQAPAGRSRRARRPDMGTDTMSDIPIRNVQREMFNSQLSTGCPKGRMVVGIWGQTRCPIWRSGTFNVKRSTLNFQLGARKGAWWPGYGDRHGIWATGLLAQRT